AVGTVQVTNCAVTGNTALDAGGGMAFAQGTLTLSRSTLAGNQVGGTGYAGRGGGLWGGSRSKTFKVTNCTIANHTAIRYTSNGPLPRGGGGGLCVAAPMIPAPVMSVVASTVAGNRTDGAGGGVWVGALAPLTLDSTLVALNAATAAPDISGALAAASSWNL